MNIYQATVVTNLVGGNDELDVDQIRRRRHAVTKNEDGSYAVKNKIQFKIGEEFGYDGEVPKGLANNLAELVDETEAELVVEYPVHVGGGTWELSNGEKVRGKKKAIAAEAELVDETEDDGEPEDDSEPEETDD